MEIIQEWGCCRDIAQATRLKPILQNFSRCKSQHEKGPNEVTFPISFCNYGSLKAHRCFAISSKFTYLTWFSYSYLLQEIVCIINFKSIQQACLKRFNGREIENSCLTTKFWSSITGWTVRHTSTTVTNQMQKTYENANVKLFSKKKKLWLKHYREIVYFLNACTRFAKLYTLLVSL